MSERRDVLVYTCPKRTDKVEVTMTLHDVHLEPPVVLEPGDELYISIVKADKWATTH
jgi:hypothetical protein